MLEAYRQWKMLNELEAQLPHNVEQVEQKLNVLLKTDPQNLQANLILARCFVLSNDPKAARLAFENLIKHHPDDTSARIELAKICFAEKDVKNAIDRLTEVTQVRPEMTDVWQLLSEYLRHDGQTEASQSASKQHDLIKAFNERLQAAEQVFANSDFKSADTICRQLLQLVPNEVRTLRLLARIARLYRHYEFSTSTLARCVATRPGDVALGLDYAYSLLGSRRYREALTQCEELVERAPENIAVQELKAEVLYNLGEYREAIGIYRELCELPEKRASSLLHLGTVLKTVGDTSEAQNCYREAIAVEPTLGQAYWELADLKTYRFSGDEIASMRDLLEGGTIAPLNKVLIEFALGKAFEDARQFAESFERYQAGNRDYARIRPYRHVSRNAQFRKVFTEDYFTARRESGSETESAIFVVGLPRSGSTLLEQILSSHSRVDATRELDEITSIARDMNDPSGAEQGQYPLSVADLDSARIRELADRYLDYVRPYRQQAPRFVDKAPVNFQHLGLIKTLFPKASIIDIRRDPMASGWSMYKQFFADSFLFSYDLETIGHYYRDYVDLMDHWHSVLPNQILTIRYEDLVQNLRATVATVLHYCGLDFEEACIEFHLNKRAVATPSSEQVRQPIYTDAIEHWKHFEEYLAPLKQALAGQDQ
jgi:predicted Zn-dependent protease